MGIINFDTTNMEPAGSSGGGLYFKTDGWHQVMISDSVGKGSDTKGADGKSTAYVLTLDLKCLAGEDKDRVTQDRMNIFHTTSADAQRIGQERLTAYSHAVGRFKLDSDNAEELRGVPFWVRTETTLEEDRNGKTDDKGNVKKYHTTKIYEWDKNDGPKHGTTGNASTASATPPPAANGAVPSEAAKAEEAPVQAGWGAPPPSTGAAAAPANKAPWNAG